MRDIWKRMLLICCLLCLFTRCMPMAAAASEAEVQINVGQVGKKTSSFSVGERHSWYIRCRITEEWENLGGVTVLQTLSRGLTMDPGSFQVSLILENGEPLPLKMEQHYQLTAGGVFVENGSADRLCVSLTQEGMVELSEQKASELRITYQARINTTAPIGNQILSTAQLNLTDPAGNKRVYLSDKAAASSGGAHILLTNREGTPLAGGRFLLARAADEKALADPAVPKELLEIEEEIIAVVYERFYTSDDMLGEKMDTAVTDEKGRATLYGLAFGTYYLVQAESPGGELLPSKPIPVTIDEASHLTLEAGWKDAAGNLVDKTVHITGSMLVMPQTGGIGTAPYTVSGTVVILCACMLLWYNRKTHIYI